MGYKAACLLAVFFLGFFLPAAEGQEKTEAHKPRPPEVQIVTAEGATVVVISGVGPVDKHGKVTAPDDFSGQFRQALENLRRLAAGAGSPLGNIVSMTVYLKEENLQERFTELHRETFETWNPATTFAVTKKFRTPGAMLEIHAVAIIVERRRPRRN